MILVQPNVVPPVTIPLLEPIVAMDVTVLAQVPPPASESVIVAPMHTAVGPLMAPGNGLTVIVVVIEQPVPSV